MEVWRKTCCYLYLPRLKDKDVFKLTIGAGTASEDFFGLAYGFEDDRHLGLTLGKSTSTIMDTSLLLVRPNVAKDQLAAEAAAKVTTTPTNPVKPGRLVPVVPIGVIDNGRGVVTVTPPVQTVLRQFYGRVDINPNKAKLDFSQIVEEIILQFAANSDVRVSISVEVRAESSTGFDDGLRRAVTENSRVLGFNAAEFET
jgi:hypothetical protein